MCLFCNIGLYESFANTYILIFPDIGWYLYEFTFNSTVIKLFIFFNFNTKTFILGNKT